MHLVPRVGWWGLLRGLGGGVSPAGADGSGPRGGMAQFCGKLQELRSSVWASQIEMTGAFPPWIVTPKGDESGSRLHFSSSNWAAIIREGSHTPSACSLLHLSPIPPPPFPLILGEVEENGNVLWPFHSFFPSLPHALSRPSHQVLFQWSDKRSPSFPFKHSLWLTGQHPITDLKCFLCKYVC